MERHKSAHDSRFINFLDYTLLYCNCNNVITSGQSMICYLTHHDIPCIYDDAYDVRAILLFTKVSSLFIYILPIVRQQ